MASSGYRKLEISAEGLFGLLRAISSPQRVRLERDRISTSAALTGFTADADNRLITLEIFDQWDKPGELIEPRYTQRITDTGSSSDWGTPKTLNGRHS